MNLGEEQDNTYSVANHLAALWQGHIDSGNAAGLGNLYIVQIAIGAQGVTDGYMWHPDREPRLIPGKLDTVDISLFPFCRHIFSLLEKSLAAREEAYEIIGLHWRGGENDVTRPKEYLVEHLLPVYRRLFDEFDALLGNPPVVLHRLACPDRMHDMDPTGKHLESMCYINEVFDTLAREYDNVTVFDVKEAPQYVPDVRGNGLFIKDVVHFTGEVNGWVAGHILQDYIAR